MKSIISLALLLLSFNSFAGEVKVCKKALNTTSTLYKGVKLLLVEVGVPVDLMGTPEVIPEDLAIIQQVLSKLSTDELKMLIQMAKEECLSAWKALAIDREIQLKEFGDIKILGERHEESLLKMAQVELNLR